MTGGLPKSLVWQHECDNLKHENSRYWHYLSPDYYDWGWVLIGGGETSSCHDLMDGLGRISDVWMADGSIALKVLPEWWNVAGWIWCVWRWTQGRSRRRGVVDTFFPTLLVHPCRWASGLRLDWVDQCTLIPLIFFLSFCFVNILYTSALGLVIGIMRFVFANENPLKKFTMKQGVT